MDHFNQDYPNPSTRIYVYQARTEVFVDPIINTRINDEAAMIEYPISITMMSLIILLVGFFVGSLVMLVFLKWKDSYESDESSSVEEEGSECLNSHRSTGDSELSCGRNPITSPNPHHPEADKEIDLGSSEYSPNSNISFSKKRTERFLLDVPLSQTHSYRFNGKKPSCDSSSADESEEDKSQQDVSSSGAKLTIQTSNQLTLNCVFTNQKDEFTQSSPEALCDSPSKRILDFKITHNSSCKGI